MSESKALSKAHQQALATYSNDATEMADELDKDSYAIPRIAVLEKMSPEVDADDAEYIEGAKPGMLCNKVMGELSERLKIIPVMRRRIYLEWVPRDAGGGFVAEHNTADGAELMEQTTRNDKNVDILPNGNEIHNVLEFYVLSSNDGGESWEPAIISMHRTRMAEGKKWNMRIDSFSQDGQKIIPLAQVYDLTTGRREKNGNTSYVYKVGACQFLPEVTKNDGAVFIQAKEFLEGIKAGNAKVDRDTEAQTTGTAGEDEEF